MGGDIRDEQGNTAHDPSDGELATRASEETLATRPSFPVLDPSRNAGKVGNMDGACPNRNIPKHDGGPLDGPGPQRVKTGEAVGSELEDLAFT